MTPPAEASAPAAIAAIAQLERKVAPLAPQTTVNEAAERMLAPEYAELLCIPIVDDGVAVGTLSRHQLNRIFLHRFGRELWGSRPVSQVMNAQPLLVDADAPLEQAAQHVAANIGTPITEDFVLVREDRYAGMGVVVDLLGAMQQRVEAEATKLAEAYRQLKSSQAALVQSEKMASLGQMVAGVAHEINTPLGYVRNNVEMVQGVFGQVREMLGEYDKLTTMLVDDGVDEQALSRQIFNLTAAATDLRDNKLLEDTEALFGDTLFGVDTIKDLVVNLRNFSRLDSARVAEISINDCLDQTLVIANNVLRSHVEVIKRYGDVPPVRCSPSQINQVFLNMMTNAAQAIDRPDGKLLLKTETVDGMVRVSIQDNGRGIPPENLRKIFDPFFTTKPVGQGTGLGLSISYQIVQAHGGTIQVASVVGRGTRFVIDLPFELPDQGAASAAA